MQSLLSLLIWLPIFGGAATLALGTQRAQAARWLALAVAIATLLVSVPLLAGYDAASGTLQFVENIPWIGAIHANYHLGADGISVALIALTTFVTVLVILGA